MRARAHPGKNVAELAKMIVFVGVDQYRRLAVRAELGYAHDFELSG